jgi:hypothetical protein
MFFTCQMFGMALVISYGGKCIKAGDNLHIKHVYVFVWNIAHSLMDKLNFLFYLVKP